MEEVVHAAMLSRCLISVETFPPWLMPKPELSVVAFQARAVPAEVLAAGSPDSWEKS